MIIETKDYITVFGILATLLISCFNLFISFRNSRKTLFINSITSSRIKWIETLRNTISEFCGLTHHFSLTVLTEYEKKTNYRKN